jgi:hypothetical protein
MRGLLGYELKKIMRKPFALVVLLGCIAFMALIPIMNEAQWTSFAWGPERYGSYEAIPPNELKRSQEDFGMTGTYDGVLVFTGNEAAKMDQELEKYFEGTWDDARIAQVVADYKAYKEDPSIYTDVIDEY